MLIKLWGAEKVVECWKNLYPNADIFTLLYDEKKVWNIFPPECIDRSCFSLASQRCYQLTKNARLSLVFMQRSIKTLDLRDYDIVLVSSSSFAHRCEVWKHTKKIVYYHAPARYLWDWTHEYRRSIRMNVGILGFFYGQYMKHLRIWDLEAWGQSHIALANSQTTQGRIKKYYRKDSDIVYPPVDTQRFATKLRGDLCTWKREVAKWNFYIILSALTEFKRIEIALHAWKHISNVDLYIIWEWSYQSELEKLSGTHTHFLWAKFWDELVFLVQKSLGLIFPWEEDFGIVPIEILAAGKPVFALRAWGLTETLAEWVSWEFFEDANGSDFETAFHRFHKNNLAGKYLAKNCRNQAKKYDIQIFENYFSELLKREL